MGISLHAGIVNCDPWAADGVVGASRLSPGARLLLLLLFMFHSLEKGV